MPAALKCANKPVSLVFSGGGVFASQHESCHAALRSHLEASAHPIGDLTHHLLLLVESPRIEFAYDTASGQSQRPRLRPISMSALDVVPALAPPVSIALSLDGDEGQKTWCGHRIRVTAGVAAVIGSAARKPAAAVSVPRGVRQFERPPIASATLRLVQCRQR